MNTTRNARFTVFYNEAYVTLTLRPGQIIHHSKTTDCFLYQWIYEFDGENVTMWDMITEITEETGPKDGWSMESHYTCPLDALLALEDEDGSILIPAWNRWAYDVVYPYAVAA